MTLTELSAISPVDGRYRNKVQCLDQFFSEFALIKYRVRVEIEYFCKLMRTLPQLAPINLPQFHQKLRDIYQQFTIDNAAQIKEIEKTTNHDVKAVEYFIKNEFHKLEIHYYKEFIHFGLTSQDINNTAIPLAIKEFLETTYHPEIQAVIDSLKKCVNDWRNVPMLAKTHGQPASPTRLGKEFQVFVYRIEQQLMQLKAIPISAKFGGAVGNFNAHHVAYPQFDWQLFADQFVSENLGLVRERWTTQISNYDNLAALFDAVSRVNVILIDLCRDVWQYVSADYFKQRIKEGEVGSSAMPHKVNPIDFENAEGNLGIANAILTHFSQKLPISRLQRDLTDSTVLRNVGVPFAHTIIATHSLYKGLGKLLLQQDVIRQELDQHWAVVSEAIQTILRREAVSNPYELLKALTRTNEEISQDTITQFIKSLPVSDKVKKELEAITPHNYTGI
jgi:adenylosuccinate lyase